MYTCLTHTNLTRPIRWASPNPSEMSRWVNEKLSDENNVVLSRHASMDRLKQRGFTMEDVLAILRKGHAYRAEKGDFEGEVKVNFSKSMGDRDAAVAVLVSPSTSQITVLTVMWVDRSYMK